MKRLRALRDRRIAAMVDGRAVALPSGHVRARAVRIDFDKRVMQITYRIGALTDDGSFVHDSEYRDIVLSIRGSGSNREAWDNAMEGRSTININELSQAATYSSKLKSIAKTTWNVDIDDVEEDGV